MRNSFLKFGRSAVLELLGHDDHFPCCAEDRLVTLLLPEFNVEFPVRKSISNYSSFPRPLLICFHGLPLRPFLACLGGRKHFFCIPYLLDCRAGLPSIRLAFVQREGYLDGNGVVRSSESAQS